MKKIDAKTLKTKKNPDGSCAECEEWCPQGVVCNCKCFEKRTGLKADTLEPVDVK